MSSASTTFEYTVGSGDDAKTYEVEGTCTFVGPEAEIDEPDEWSVVDEHGKEVSDEALGDHYALIRGELVDRCFEKVKAQCGDDDGTDYGDSYDDCAFADPGGMSALRAATTRNPRNLPCPTCGTPNVLTPADVERGYQCNRCADAAERGF